jgi:hypothetical protein
MILSHAHGAKNTLNRTKKELTTKKIARQIQRNGSARREKLGESC